MVYPSQKPLFLLKDSAGKVVFLLFLRDVLEECYYFCTIKGFTEKTMKNKRQEYKQLINFLEEKRRLTELENITHFDLSAYIRQKQKQGLQPQSIVSMYKMISAFFNWCVKEKYLKENPMAKVPVPKVPKKVVEGLTSEEVNKMINSFSFNTYIEARNKAIIAMSFCFSFFCM